MAKRQYRSPVLMELDPSDDPTHVIGASQGTIGVDTTYTFVGIDDDEIAMILANCSDFDLKDMAGGDYEITMAEYEAWYEEHGWW